MRESRSLTERLPSLGTVPIIGILRRCPLNRVEEIAQSAATSGLATIEVTLDSDQPLTQIRLIVEAFPGLTVGAGTVFDGLQVAQAIEAGASFIVSPVASPAVLAASLEADCPYLPGASTPTEIWNAYNSGATAVKVFPAHELGGPGYLSALRAPLEGVPLVATGGVGVDDIGTYLAAGASAVGLGGPLFPKNLIEGRRFSELSELIAKAVARAS